ncbi:MAG: alpha/beta hydrolase [Clostridia bacterium]|nr:alpha/beta hydrolase [Clostridia bacterium]
MDILMKMFTKLWENTEKADNARLATQTAPEGITEINNIAYIDDGNRYHLLDLYYPENATGKLPVIIDIHGGGWMYADKELNKIFCLNMAKRGFAVFNISYRLVPEVTVNEQLSDCAYALKWISENGCNYPVCDMDNVMLAGDSAGGQLSVYSALLMSSAELRKIFGTPDYNLNLRSLTLISPVAYMNQKGYMGVYTNRMWGKDYKKKNTYKYMNLDVMLVKGKLPPVYLVTSSGDFLALKQTRKAAEDMSRYVSDVKLTDFEKFEGEDLPHVFCVLEPESKAGSMVIDEYISFFMKHTTDFANK